MAGFAGLACYVRLVYSMGKKALPILMLQRIEKDNPKVESGYRRGV